MSNERTMTCVRRNIGEMQVDMRYVPIEEVSSVTAGETLYSGLFTTEVQRRGPSGSDSRTVCQPVNEAELVRIVAESTYDQQYSRPRAGA